MDRVALEAVVSDYAPRDGPVAYRLLDSDPPDSRLIDWVHGLLGGPLDQVGVEFLSLDEILDGETVAEIARA